jgi:protein-S-isoprenylcysteine O-methyltransferase Ste14
VLAALYLSIVPYREFEFHNGIWLAFCVAVSVLGQVIRAMVIGFVPKGTSGRNIAKQVATVLNTEGIYSVVRHPLYLGNYFMWMGPVLYSCSISFAVICSLLFWIYYERIMYAEEAFLRGKFGNYDEWASTTPAFWPDFKLWRPAALTFSLRNVIRREFYGVVAVVFSFLFVHILHLITTRLQFIPSDEWLLVSGGTLVLFFVLRFLKKKTKVLNTDRS